MGADHLAEIHPVQLVPGENEDIVDSRGLDALDVLADRVGRPLVPVAAIDGLLGGQHLDKSTPKQIELVRLVDVAVETDRVELREHINAVQPTVEAVRDRDVDQTVFARQRNSRFRTQLGEGKQAGSFAATQNQSDDVVHCGCGGRAAERGTGSRES